MATFFGEVLPEFSRAVDDDEDNDELNIINPSSVLRWCPEARKEIEQNKCLECSTLVVAIGPAATGFVQTYILDNQPSDIIGIICSGMNDKETTSFAQQSPMDKNCYIYQIKEKRDVIIVQCKVDISPEQAFSWSEQLLTREIKLVPKVHTEDTFVAILCSQLLSNYKTDKSPEDIRAPFLRALKSSQFKRKPVAPFLEQPNFVSGLPAQLLTHSQVHQIPAVLYVCYTDVPYLDIETIKAFKPVLNSTPVTEIVEENSKADSNLLKLIDLHMQHSTLYI